MISSQVTLNSEQSVDMAEVLDCRQSMVKSSIEYGFIKPLRVLQQLLGFTTLQCLQNLGNTASDQLQRRASDEPYSYCEKSAAFYDAG